MARLPCASDNRKICNRSPNTMLQGQGVATIRFHPACAKQFHSPGVGYLDFGHMWLDQIIQMPSVRRRLDHNNVCRLQVLLDPCLQIWSVHSARQENHLRSRVDTQEDPVVFVCVQSHMTHRCTVHFRHTLTSFTRTLNLAHAGRGVASHTDSGLDV